MLLPEQQLNKEVGKYLGVDSNPFLEEFPFSKNSFPVFKYYDISKVNFCVRFGSEITGVKKILLKDLI